MRAESLEQVGETPPEPKPSTVVALLRQMRPRQWTKNFAVYAALLFSKSVFVKDLALKSTFAVAAFCLISSGIYVLNDWVDREKDRLHPEKRKRPIAAGHLGAPHAMALALFCWVGGALLAVAAGYRFALLAAGYVVLQFLYSLFLKRMVIVDVMIIATGFVIRVIGGGVAINVPISNWLFLCTLLLAVFLGFAKRRHELSSLQGEAVAHRASLNEYTLPLLDQMMSIVAAACVVAYGLYSVSKETIDHVGSDRLKYTVPFVIYGIFRYLFLVHRKGLGGSPERILLSDIPLIVDLMLYVAACAWALYSPV